MIHLNIRMLDLRILLKHSTLVVILGKTAGVERMGKEEWKLEGESN